MCNEVLESVGCEIWCHVDSMHQSSALGKNSKGHDRTSIRINAITRTPIICLFGKFEFYESWANKNSSSPTVRAQLTSWGGTSLPTAAGSPFPPWCCRSWSKLAPQCPWRLGHHSGVNFPHPCLQLDGKKIVLGMWTGGEIVLSKLN